MIQKIDLTENSEKKKASVSRNERKQGVEFSNIPECSNEYSSSFDKGKENQKTITVDKGKRNQKTLSVEKIDTPKKLTVKCTVKKSTQDQGNNETNPGGTSLLINSERTPALTKLNILEKKEELNEESIVKPMSAKVDTHTPFPLTHYNSNFATSLNMTSAELCNDGHETVNNEKKLPTNESEDYENKQIETEKDTSRFSLGTKKCTVCSLTYYIQHIITPNGCQHNFCIDCFESYFKTNYNMKSNFTKDCFKCLIVGCDKEFNFGNVSSFLRKTLIENATKEETDPIKYTQKAIRNLKQCVKSKDDFIKKGKVYVDKNVIDVSTNEEFYLYSKKKFEICPICNGEYLFTRKQILFLVCLKCLRKFCRFCKKRYTENHLSPKNPNRCKLYFRRNTQKRSQLNCCLLIIRNILLMIACYFVMLFGFFCYIDDFLGCMLCRKKMRKYCISRCCYYMMKFILVIILLCIYFPICIILIPYFPLITSL